jgi:hypothetical protein
MMSAVPLPPSQATNPAPARTSTVFSREHLCPLEMITPTASADAAGGGSDGHVYDAQHTPTIQHAGAVHAPFATLPTLTLPDVLALQPDNTTPHSSPGRQRTSEMHGTAEDRDTTTPTSTAGSPSFESSPTESDARCSRRPWSLPLPPPPPGFCHISGGNTFATFHQQRIYMCILASHSAISLHHALTQ